MADKAKIVRDANVAAALGYLTRIRGDLVAAANSLYLAGEIEEAKAAMDLLSWTDTQSKKARCVGKEKG